MQKEVNPFFQKDKKSIGFFITAGYPELNSLPQCLMELQENGVDFIEIGMPFSDPMADGETIQHSSALAIKNGMTIDIMFEQIQSIRSEINIPIVLMGYLNPIWKYGIESFLECCQKLKITSLIIPDLSASIYQRDFKKIFEQKKIGISFLITPLTSNDRILEMMKLSEHSFLYLVSGNNITGSQLVIDHKMKQRYQEIKAICSEIPIFIGFGIADKVTVLEASSSADGVIIGSAYLRALAENRGEEFISEILG